MASTSVGTAIFQHATGDTGITDLIGTSPEARMYPNLAPQTTSLPYIVYGYISGSRVRDLSGPTGVTQDRYQIDHVARTALGAEVLADEFRERFESFAGDMGTVALDVRRAFLDDVSGGVVEAAEGSQEGFYRRTQELTVWHAESAVQN